MKRKPEVVKAGSVSVKIYTVARPGGEYFQVPDYSTGKRVLRSFGSRDDARQEAARIARLLSSGDAKAAAMRNGEAASYGRAIELLEPTGDALELAAARYAEAVKILGDGAKLVEAARTFAHSNTLPSKTVADVVAEMLAEKERKNREKRTLDDLRNRLARFSEAFSGPIATITKSDVQQWLDGLKTSERDRLNYRSKVGTLFRWAWRRDYVLTNPVEKTEKPDAGEGEIAIYDKAEIQRLIEAAEAVRRDFLPALLIGAFAGLRSSEIERLKWEDVNQARGFITASAKKRGTPSRRLVPIQPNLAAWLAPYAARRGKVWSGTHDGFSDAQQDIANAAKTQWKHNGLRHSFISCRLAVVEDVAKVALEAGNSVATIHAHYRELVTPDDGKAWFGIAPVSASNVLPMGEAANA